MDEWKDIDGLEDWHASNRDPVLLWLHGDETQNQPALDDIAYRTSPETRLRARFNELVNQWHREIRHKSSLRRMVFNRPYLAIMLMAADDDRHKRLVVGLILEELRDRGGHWLWALHALTGASPAKFGDSFVVARDAWIEWGRRHGYFKDKRRT